MTNSLIQRALERQPFLPFKVRVAGDGEYAIPTADHASLHPGGRVLYIHLGDESSAVIDVPFITSIHTGETL
jgi:hypothetical protein